MASTSSKDSNQPQPERDFWSKLQILLAPLGTLLTAITVAILGFWGSSYLNKKQELDTRARIYAELISQREQAESALRKDMFVSIIDAFLKPEAISNDVKILNMELLAYNFHESLNLKPLFAYLQRKVGESKEDETAKKKLRRRLEKVAGDVTGKQMLVLAEVGQKFDDTIDLTLVRDNPGGRDPEPRTLNLDGIERTFRLLPLKVDDESHELQFRLVIIGPKTGEQNQFEFWLGFYDFPMIDNTRLAHDQRCAVVLNKFEEDRADVTLIYFPGSRASLKEKPFYDDVIANLQATPASNPRK
jgi:hypothetical protein